MEGGVILNILKSLGALAYVYIIGVCIGFIIAGMEKI